MFNYKAKKLNLTELTKLGVQKGKSKTMERNVIAKKLNVYRRYYFRGRF